MVAFPFRPALYIDSGKHAAHDYASRSISRLTGRNRRMHRERASGRSRCVPGDVIKTSGERMKAGILSLAAAFGVVLMAQSAPQAASAENAIQNANPGTTEISSQRRYRRAHVRVYRP